MKILLKGGKVISPKNKLNEKIDILFEKEVITKIEKNIDATEADIVLDVKNMIVSPGFVDLHSNFMDPGAPSKEDLKTGCLGSAKGGFTSIILGTENKPSPDQINVVDYIKNWKRIMPIKIYPMGAITEDRLGEDLCDLKFLYSHGVIGFSDGLRSIEDKDVLNKALNVAKEIGVPISIYPEDLSKIKIRGINEGDVSSSLGIGASPRIAEEIYLLDLVEMAMNIPNLKLDIAYISTKRSVELMEVVSKLCPNIQAEVQALSLILTDKAINKDGSLAKVLPPLRQEIDRKALIKGLQDDVIKIISSNHMPCLEEEKKLKLKEAVCGAIGLETVLGICGMKLVEPGFLTWDKVIEKISVNPAKFYSIDAGELRVGGPADITIFDPNEEWVVKDNFKSKSHNSPLIGTKLKGKVKFTICKGQRVYKDEIENGENVEEKKTK